MLEQNKIEEQKKELEKREELRKLKEQRKQEKQLTIFKQKTYNKQKFNVDGIEFVMSKDGYGFMFSTRKEFKISDVFPTCGYFKEHNDDRILNGSQLLRVIIREIPKINRMYRQKKMMRYGIVSYIFVVIVMNIILIGKLHIIYVQHGHFKIATSMKILI
jgi:transcription termination factor Rho